MTLTAPALVVAPTSSPGTPTTRSSMPSPLKSATTAGPGWTVAAAPVPPAAIAPAGSAASSTAASTMTRIVRPIPDLPPDPPGNRAEPTKSSRQVVTRAQCPASCWISERRRRPSVGLHTNQLAPRRSASSRSSWRSEEVSATTGSPRAASSARRWRSTSKPSIRGILRSSRTSWGRPPGSKRALASRSTACSPSAATSTLTARSSRSARARRIRNTWSSSSSTSRIRSVLTGPPPRSAPGPASGPRRRPEDADVGPAVALDADAAAQHLDDLAADGQPHPGPVAGRRPLQPLEDPEHPLAVLGRDALAVVAHRQLHAAVGSLVPVHDHDQVGPAAVADGVLEQVGEQLAQPDRVAGDHRQAPDPELHPGVGRARVLGD